MAEGEGPGQMVGTDQRRPAGRPAETAMHRARKTYIAVCDHPTSFVIRTDDPVSCRALSHPPWTRPVHGRPNQRSPFRHGGSSHG